MKILVSATLSLVCLSAFSVVRPVCNSDKPLSRGDLVLDSDSVREVEFVANKKKIVLKSSSSYYRKFTKMRDVSQIVDDCLEFRIGQSVLNGDSVRVIEYLDANGRVVLKSDSSYYRKYTTIYDISSLVEILMKLK